MGFNSGFKGLIYVDCFLYFARRPGTVSRSLYESTDVIQLVCLVIVNRKEEMAGSTVNRRYFEPGTWRGEEALFITKSVKIVF